MKYDILYIDPPWQYRDKATAGKRGAAFKYNTQGTNELMSIPIQDISSNNSLLFLWVTMPKLPDAFNIINAWGFKYKTVAFTWVKTNKKAGTLFWGMGNWTRANAELCLLATKGSPKRINAGVHSVVMEPMLGHSRKPIEVKRRIVSLCGDKPRIEIFARNLPEFYNGWRNIGIEITGNDIKDDIERIKL